MDEQGSLGPAQTLEEAHGNFDQRNWAHMNDKELESFYEKRTDHDNLKRLIFDLRSKAESGRVLHALYMGLSGCGKSTDLTWLVEKIGEDEKLAEGLLIIHFDVGDVVGTNHIGFAQFAIALVLEIYREFRDLKLPLDTKHLASIEEWLFGSREVHETTLQRRGGGLDVRLKFLRLEVAGRRIREEKVVLRLANKVSDLWLLLEALLNDVWERTGKKVLFVVDDLEKINPLDAALGLFLNHGGFFADLSCHLLLTAPGALRLDPRFGPDVLSHFVEFRAMLARPLESGADTEFRRLKRLVYRRVSDELIDEEAVDLAIVKTGGVVGTLVEVLERSALNAMTKEAKKMTRLDVADALNDVQGRWHHSLRNEGYVELDRVNRSGVNAHLEKPELLHALAVLEYPDSPSVFVVHPLVVPLLERWKLASRR